MSLNGIDIASHQKDINLSLVPSDFVIVKATQGTTYVNPYFEKKVQEALRLGKLIGVYHYASKGGATAEANFFLKTINKYLGKAILIFDWESYQNENWGNYAYCQQFMDHVYKQTGHKCVLYMSKSVARETGWKISASSVPATYDTFIAQYANKNKTGYQSNPWTDNKGLGLFRKPIIYQYSSTGQLNGYNGNLDLDIAYMTKTEWENYAIGRYSATNDTNIQWNWSNQSYVKTGPVSNTTPGKYKTLVTLNVRSGPGTTSPVIGSLPKGSVITADKVEKGFLHFSGYCSAKNVYVKKV